MSTTKPARWHHAHWKAAQAVLQTVWFDARPADASLQNWFRDHRQMGSRDRAQVSGLIYGVLRDAMAIARLAGPEADAQGLLLTYALRHAAVETPALTMLAGADAVADAAARLATNAAQLTAADQHNVPAPLWAAWCAQYGETETAALARTLLQEAPVDLRVNTLKTDRASARAALHAEGIDAEPTPWSPLGLRLARRAPLTATRVFRDGGIELQDEGSQLLTMLLGAAPGQRVADYCAGAGGKTLAIGAAMQNRGELWALDISRTRLERLPPRAQRAGLSALHWRTLPDARWMAEAAGRFDAVLVDAPCSGTGTWRRNPELRLRPIDPQALASLQGEILAAAASLVRPGGRLVYATCSLLAAENDAVVAAWHAGAPAFRPLPVAAAAPALGALADGAVLRLLPHRHGTDGFFAACFEREA